MRAVIWTRYGPPDVLQLQEVATPIPKAEEVLVRIVATTVTAGDCELRGLNLPLWIALPMRLFIGISKPRGKKIPGTEFSGIIESVGSSVTQFKIGDAVFGSAGLNFGANAEYITLPEEPKEGVLAHKPANLSFDEAACVPFGGLDALHFLNQADIQPGDKVLINGAGGSIGTYAVQLAKLRGAEVTAVDSAAKLEMLLSIGADHVIDYAQNDFTENGQIYDVIFDVVGKSSFSGSLSSLAENGFYLLANPRISHMLRAFWATKTGSKKVFFQPASHNIDHLIFLRELIEMGKLKTIIDRRYPLENIAAAHRYVETGQKIGNLVITVTNEAGQSVL